MSMTKINDENSDNEVPRSSTVIFPGQSHISRGITVLVAPRSYQRNRKKTDESYALEGMLRYSYGSLQKESLLRRQLVKEDVEYGCFPCPVSPLLNTSDSASKFKRLPPEAQ